MIMPSKEVKLSFVAGMVLSFAWIGQSGSAIAQDCFGFEGEKTLALESANVIEKELKDLKEMWGPTPEFNAGVCGAAIKLKRHASAAVALASSACDPGQSAKGALNKMLNAAESQITWFCAAKTAQDFYFRATTAYLENDDLALADYNEAIRLDPKYAPAFIERGLVYERKNDVSRAIADFGESIRLDPKGILTSTAYFQRGIIYMQIGDYNRAIADFTELIRRGNAATSLNLRGEAYMKLGQYDRAIADFDAAIRQIPNFQEAIKNRAAAIEKAKPSSK